MSGEFGFDKQEPPKEVPLLVDLHVPSGSCADILALAKANPDTSADWLPPFSVSATAPHKETVSQNADGSKTTLKYADDGTIKTSTTAFPGGSSQTCEYQNGKIEKITTVSPTGTTETLWLGPSGKVNTREVKKDGIVETTDYSWDMKVKEKTTVAKDGSKVVESHKFNECVSEDYFDAAGKLVKNTNTMKDGTKVTCEYGPDGKRTKTTILGSDNSKHVTKYETNKITDEYYNTTGNYTGGTVATKDANGNILVNTLDGDRWTIASDLIDSEGNLLVQTKYRTDATREREIVYYADKSKSITIYEPNGVDQSERWRIFANGQAQKLR